MVKYKKYMHQVVLNAKTLANELISLGYKVISGGTDNHLILVDVKSSCGITGLEAQNILESVNITLNKNSIPGDKEKPAFTSGIRFGTPAMTTRGFDENDFIQVAHFIDSAIKNRENSEILDKIKNEVIKMLEKHPLP